MNPKYSLDGLPNERLLVNLKQLVGSSNELTAHLLAHLAEVEGRGLYRDCACASLYTYCVYELRFSEDEAQRRCRAARVARQFPLIFDMLADASIHLTGILLLAPHLTQQNHVELLARARYRTKREIEKLVSEVAPYPDAPSLIQPLGPPVPSQHASATWAGFVRAWAGPVRELVPGDGHGQAPFGALARQAAAESADVGGERPHDRASEPAERGDGTAWPAALQTNAAAEHAMAGSAAPRAGTEPGHANAGESMPWENASENIALSDAAPDGSVRSAGVDSKLNGAWPGHDQIPAPARQTFGPPAEPSPHSPTTTPAPARQTFGPPAGPWPHSSTTTPAPARQTFGPPAGPSPHSPAMTPAPARQRFESRAGEPVFGLRYRLQFTADQGYVDLLEQARDLLQHQVPDRDLARVHRLAIEALLEKLSKRKGAALGPKGSSAGSGVPAGSPREGAPVAARTASTGCACAHTPSPDASASRIESSSTYAPVSRSTRVKPTSAEPAPAAPGPAEPQCAAEADPAQPRCAAPTGPSPAAAALAGPEPTYAAPTGVAPAGPAPADPEPKSAAPAGPLPAGATPAGPAPAGAIPAGPAPQSAAPAGPAPADPEPTYAAPTGPAPADPEPKSAAPAGPAPADPEPKSAAPAGPAPAGPAPAGAIPAGPAPQSAAPAGPAPRSTGLADADGQRRHIPAALKREVWERDGGRCTFTDARGERCRETCLLEFHHQEPFARGGPTRLDNVSLHCRSHNRLAAERDFGRDFIARRVNAAAGAPARDPARH